VPSRIYRLFPSGSWDWPKQAWIHINTVYSILYYSILFLLSPVLFNLYLDEGTRIWLQKLNTSKYFKELIFNTLLFAGDQFIISDTEDNLQKAVYLLYNIYEEYNLEIATKRRKCLVSLGRIT